MSDDWFSSKLAPDGAVEDGCHPEEAQAMKYDLRQETTATEAARAITHPIVAADNPREDLARLWGFLMDSLLELPAEHTGPLSELLKAIENLPEPDFTAIDESQTALRKALERTAAATNGPARGALRGTHVRKAEIEALLVTAGLGGIPVDWGYEVVADALESGNALLDFEVPAAARWLVICGQRFRQGAENGEKSWALKQHVTTSSMTPSRDLLEASSDQVLSLGRWSWWEGRLRELQGKQGVVQDAATTALDAMREAVHAPT
ncbi:hypothetical protein LA080_006659 [Diaporthe eres]|nr:hypothetical protein LA080_006659 [Diaporthe eres]